MPDTEVAGSSNARREGPLLEREHELTAIAEALDRVGEGTGSLLLIEGPAGIGKTQPSG